MPESPLGIIDRFEIDELLKRYVLALDSGDAEGVVDAFTPDGVLQDGSGKRFRGRDGLRQFAIDTFARHGTRGRQHHVQRLAIEPDGNGYRVRSYWFGVRWSTAEDTKSITSIGSYDDICVKTETGWRFRSRLISRWNDKSEFWLRIPL